MTIHYALVPAALVSDSALWRVRVDLNNRSGQTHQVVGHGRRIEIGMTCPDCGTEIANQWYFIDYTTGGVTREYFCPDCEQWTVVRTIFTREMPLPEYLKLLVETRLNEQKPPYPDSWLDVYHAWA